MQLILELFKKIFVALQGVYTKAESDAALATKADATALESEAQAREQADAKHDAEIDWLKTAVDGDWKTYMLGRAKLTGIQKNIDTVNRAINEYFENASSWLANQLITCHSELFLYESFSGEKFEANFWTSFFVALEDYEANPTVDIEWNVVDEGGGTYSSNCPHFYESPTAPVVNFRVRIARGLTNYSPLIKDMRYPVYLPNAQVVTNSVCRGETFNFAFVCLKAINNNYLFHGTPNYDKPFMTKATSVSGLFWNAGNNSPKKVWVENATSGDYFAMNNRTFDTFVSFKRLQNGASAFTNTAMSPANIAKTLDSLPAHASGTHVISFSRFDKTKLAPLMAESPYKESVDAAVARGWTVQFDI